MGSTRLYRMDTLEDDKVGTCVLDFIGWPMHRILVPGKIMICQPDFSTCPKLSHRLRRGKEHCECGCGSVPSMQNAGCIFRRSLS